ncbi:MAG: hypothetical protein Q8J78_00440 [Moraxellaceae bacterium]|nr:hypothetical protein [Moraxellaceae bacterium]
MQVARSPTERLEARKDEYEDLPPNPIYRGFVEVLILAIIDAYPGTTSVEPHSKRRWKRLKQVFEGLFDAKLGDRTLACRDLPALLASKADRLAEEAHAVALEMPTAVVSERQSARRAAPLGRKQQNRWDLDAQAERLRKAARLANGRLPENGDEDDLSAYARFYGLGGLHREELDWLHALYDLEKILEEWGVKMSVDVRKLGLATQWEK